MKEIVKIKKLISKLNKASDEYYNNKSQSMTDREWDLRFDELTQLETQTGIVFSNSPTQNVGYEIVKGLKEIKHKYPLLSLDKSKEINDIIKFKNKEQSLFGDKLDGLTLSLIYENGLLIKGATRGNGEIGFDVTHNVKRLKSVPQQIPYNKPLTVSGECVSSYDNFF